MITLLLLLVLSLVRLISSLSVPPIFLVMAEGEGQGELEGKG